MSIAGPIRGTLDRPLLTGKQVAEMLGLRPGWFYRRHPELERRGFPGPVTHGLYDARAVHAWLDAQMSPKLRKVLQAQGAAA